MLVHCQAGVSRSASGTCYLILEVNRKSMVKNVLIYHGSNWWNAVIISYLMKTKNMVLDDALGYVAERRSIIAYV